MPPRGSATRRPKTLTLALGLLFALSTLLAPGAGAEAGDGWWSGLDEGEAVSLANVMRGPRDYRGRTLTFFCLFHRKESYFDPLRTPFNAKRYDNLSVWPDGAAVWETKAYVEEDLPFLYIPRNHAQRDDLMRLERFTRIEVTGRIRDLLRGVPTIEIFSFRVTGHRVGKEVMKEIMRGHNYARMGTKNGYQLAAQSLKRSLTPDLAPLYAIAVRKLLAQSLRKLGFPDEAAAYERGETYGTPDLPAPDADRRGPGTGDLPRPPTGPGSDMPGRPVWDTPGAAPAGAASRQGFGSPDGAAPSPLSGSPDGDDASGFVAPGDFPPPALPGRDAARGPSGAGTPRRPASDLPGTPAVGLTSESDLPGTPGQAPPAALPPPGASRQPGSSPAPTRAADRAPVRSGPVSGIPPTRKPRLTGVR